MVTSRRVEKSLFLLAGMRSLFPRTAVVLALLLTILPLAGAEAGPAIPTGAASRIFARAHALCSADGGDLWGVSLCGPLMLADPKTQQL